MSQSHSDTTVVESILNGNKENFGILLERYKPKVFAIVAKRVPYNDIQDVAQDIFLRAYRGLNHYSRNKPFKNWLMVIALRSCCDYWRKNFRRQETYAPPGNSSCYDWLETISGEHSTDTFIALSAQKQAGESLQWTLQQLNAEDRTLIEMIYFEGRSLRETSTVLKWGMSKTKVRAMRARTKMRHLISELLEAEE